jgi:hypothetical protein
MKSLWKLVVTGVCLSGLWRPAAAQDATPALAPGGETQPAQDSLQRNTVLDLNNTAGWKLELAPTLSVFTGDGLRLSALSFGNPFGVEVADVDDTLRTQLNLADGTGVVVTAVADGGVAAQAGLKSHDIVLQINDRPVESPENFNTTVADEQGKTATIRVLRQGQPLKIEVTLPQTPHYELALTNQLLSVVDSSASLQHYRIGVTLAEADDTLRSQLRLAAGEGLVVTEVIGDGPAAGAGIKPHDVLIKLDGKRLSTVDAINAQIQEIGERQVALDYIRAGEEQTCDVTPQLSQDGSLLTGVRFWDLSNGQSASSLLLSSVGQTRSTDAAIRWLMAAQPVRDDAPDAQTDVATRIDELKRKLADITESLNALSAALQPPAQEQKPADEPQPGESKPE